MTHNVFKYWSQWQYFEQYEVTFAYSHFTEYDYFKITANLTSVIPPFTLAKLASVNGNANRYSDTICQQWPYGK